MHVRIRATMVDALDALLRDEGEEAVETLQALDAPALLALASAGYRLSRLASEVRSSIRESSTPTTRGEPE